VPTTSSPPSDPSGDKPPAEATEAPAASSGSDAAAGADGPAAAPTGPGGGPAPSAVVANEPAGGVAVAAARRPQDGRATKADPADDIDLPLDAEPGARPAGAAAPHAAPVSAPRRRKAKAAAPSAAGPLSEPAAPPAPPTRPEPPDQPQSPDATPEDAEGADRPQEQEQEHRWRSLRWLPQPAGQHARGSSAGAGAFFRVPTSGDASPDNGQLIGICTWATLLGLGGLLIAIRGLVGIIGGYAPSWYQPALIMVGMVGIVLTVLAFTAIHRRYLPWIMLGLATIPLAVNVGLTLSAL